MRYDYPDPYMRRHTLSHPVRSLLTTAILVYAGWAFRGCAEKPETLAYRLNRKIAQSPAQHESLVSHELGELHLLRSKAHRHHGTLEGFMNPRDVEITWREDGGKDYAVILLRNGHEYMIQRDGLKERFVSGLEKKAEGEE